MRRSFRAFMRAIWTGMAVGLFALSQDVPAQEQPTMEMAKDAINTGNTVDLIALLKGGLNPNSIDKDGMTMITYAVMAEKDDVLDTLLENGANPNSDAGLALALAALSDDLAVVKALVERGGDVNAQAGLYHSAPLHWACKNGHLEMVAYLLSKGAQIESTNDGGWTPLIAASTKNPEVVRLLLSKGARVDERDGYGYTSLMYAAKSGNEEMMQVLLNAGANTGMRSPDGETAADLALKSGSKEAIKILNPEPIETRQQGGTPTEPPPSPLPQ